MIAYWCVFAVQVAVYMVIVENINNSCQKCIIHRSRLAYRIPYSEDDFSTSSGERYTFECEIVLGHVLAFFFQFVYFEVTSMFRK